MAFPLKSALQNSTAIRICEQSRFHTKSVLGSSLKSPRAHGETQAKPSNFRTEENFQQLQLTAEKMMQEQACTKADVQRLRSKVLKYEEKVQALEFKLQQEANEKSVLKAKHMEDMKLWKVLETKHVGMSAMFDQITETVQQLEIQLSQGEQDKALLEKSLMSRLAFYEQSKAHTEMLHHKLTEATNTTVQREEDIQRMAQEAAEMQDNLIRSISTSEKLTEEKEQMQRQLDVAEQSLQNEKHFLISSRDQHRLTQMQLSEKIEELAKLENDLQLLVQKKTESDFYNRDLEGQLSGMAQIIDAGKQERLQLAHKVSEMERALDEASSTADNLREQIKEIEERAQVEWQAKENALQDLQALEIRYQKIDGVVTSVHHQLEVAETRNAGLQRSLDDVVRRAEDTEAASASEIKVIHETNVKLRTEKEGLEEIMHKQRNKEVELASTVQDLCEEKETLLGEISRLTTEKAQALEQLNSQLEQRTGAVEGLTLKNAELMCTLQSVEEEANRLRLDCLEKLRLLEESSENLASLEEKIKEESAKVELADSHILEIKRQSELQLEAKQADLNRHLKEIANRNNQEMSDLRMKIEAEAKEAILKESVKVKELLLAHELEKKKLTAKHHAELVQQKEQVLTEISKERQKTTDDLDGKYQQLQKDSMEELHRLQTEHKLLVSKEQQKVRELEGRISVLCQKFESDMKKREEELRAELTQYERTLEDEVAGCQLLKRDHQTEILTLQQSFQASLEESKMRNLVWESKFTSMEKAKAMVEADLQILKQQFDEEKLRYEADRETSGAAHRKTIADMQETFNKELDEIRDTCLDWERKYELQRMENSRLQTKEMQSELKLTELSTRDKIELEEQLEKGRPKSMSQLTLKCDQCLEKYLESSGKVVREGLFPDNYRWMVVHQEHAFTAPQSKQRFDKGKRNRSTDVAALTVPVQMKESIRDKRARLNNRARMRVGLDSELESLFGGCGLDPYEMDDVA